jgi:hypothetical protein
MSTPMAIQLNMAVAVAVEMVEMRTATLKYP